MQIAPKTKGIIIAIIFVVLILLPVSYALIKELVLRQNESKNALQHHNNFRTAY